MSNLTGSLDELYAEIHAEELEARKRFLQNVRCHTRSVLLAELGQGHQGDEMLALWEQAGLILALQAGSETYYPAFQFVEGSPIPVVSQLVALLRTDRDPWFVAHWFYAANDWLSGQTPISAVNSIGSALLLVAASQELLPIP